MTVTSSLPSTPTLNEAPTAQDSGRFLLVLICFVLSGFAGLLYETIWARQFALVFGTTELAVATVLAAYFGGLALGAALAGRWTTRIKKPILVYGFLELGIAASALMVPTAIRLATWLYQKVMAGEDGLAGSSGLTAAIFYLAAAFVILFVPTTLMGATLPLLARYAIHEDQQIGPRVGLLYTANTIGAVAGTLCAAFVLLPTVGLARTAWIGVGANVVVFLAAATIARTRAGPHTPLETKIAIVAKNQQGRWILPLVLMAGAVSLSYEVLWTRLLGHILGGTLYAFATMLASFLLGIALGSAVAARWASTPSRAARGFSWTQFGAGMTSLAAFYCTESLPEIAHRLGAGVGGGFAANIALAALVLLPSTLCIGASFPFAVRILARGDADAGPASARVYAWNTVGAIAGSISTGFILLPFLGYAGMLLVAASMNLALSFVTTLLDRSVGRGAIVAVLIGGLSMIVAKPGEPWGILRLSALDGPAAEGEVAYYAVGRNATVLMVDDGIHWEIRTNGLPEAVIRRRFGAPSRILLQPWLTALPVLARPEARKMLVIGLGGGVLLENAPSSIEQIDVVELEPDVIEANRRIGADRFLDPLSNPRIHLFVNDARGALVLADDRYDAIVSQPSHPWTVGASNLYTREFFALTKAHLSPDGVFIQWMGIQFIDVDLLRSLMAALRDVFENVEVYAPHPGALFFVASASPLDLHATAERAIALRPEDFTAAGIYAAEDVLASLLLPRDGVDSFVKNALPITDDMNYLQLRSYRMAGTTAIKATMFDDWLAPMDRVLSDGRPVRWRYLVQRVAAMGQHRRARRLAQTCPNIVEAQLCMGWALMAEGSPAQAANEFEKTIELYPSTMDARYALALLHRRDPVGGHRRIAAALEGLVDPARVVLEGWQWQAAKDWRRLRELDGRLAKARPVDDCYSEAMRLRVWWRVEAAEPGKLEEAIKMVDAYAPRFGIGEDYLLRTEASLALGDTRAALSALVEASSFFRPTPAGRKLARRVQSHIASLGTIGDCAAAIRLRARVEEILQ